MSLFSSINGYMTNEQISENWCKYLRQQVLWGTWQYTFVALWLSQQGQGCFVWSFLKRCFEETVGEKKSKNQTSKNSFLHGEQNWHAPHVLHIRTREELHSSPIISFIILLSLYISLQMSSIFSLLATFN